MAEAAAEAVCRCDAGVEEVVAAVRPDSHKRQNGLSSLSNARLSHLRIAGFLRPVGQPLRLSATKAFAGYHPEAFALN